MIEIKLPKKIKVGGYDYSVILSVRGNNEVRSSNRIGETSHYSQKITIETDLTEQKFSETFIHEVIHSVDVIYSDSSLSESQVSQISNGLFQVLEQLGIRFVK